MIIPDTSYKNCLNILDNFQVLGEDISSKSYQIAGMPVIQLGDSYFVKFHNILELAESTYEKVGNIVSDICRANKINESDLGFIFLESDLYLHECLADVISELREHKVPVLLETANLNDIDWTQILTEAYKIEDPNAIFFHGYNRDSPGGASSINRQMYNDLQRFEQLRKNLSRNKDSEEIFKQSKTMGDFYRNAAAKADFIRQQSFEADPTRYNGDFMAPLGDNNYGDAEEARKGLALSKYMKKASIWDYNSTLKNTVKGFDKVTEVNIRAIKSDDSLSPEEKERKIKEVLKANEKEKMEFEDAMDKAGTLDRIAGGIIFNLVGRYTYNSYDSQTRKEAQDFRDLADHIDRERLPKNIIAEAISKLRGLYRTFLLASKSHTISHADDAAFEGRYGNMQSNLVKFLQNLRKTGADKEYGIGDFVKFMLRFLGHKAKSFFKSLAAKILWWIDRLLQKLQNTASDKLTFLNKSYDKGTLTDQELSYHSPSEWAKKHNLHSEKGVYKDASGKEWKQATAKDLDYETDIDRENQRAAEWEKKNNQN